MTRFRISPIKLLGTVAAAFALALVSIFCALTSARVVQHTDSSQEDSLGLISIRGWPLTFESTAPGYSHPQNINSLNFEIDSFFYFALCCGALWPGFFIASRKTSKPPASAA